MRYHGCMEELLLTFRNIYGGVNRCLEHISPKRDTEKLNTASEREWLPLTAERYSREDVPRVEQDSPINSCFYE